MVMTILKQNVTRLLCNVHVVCKWRSQSGDIYGFRPFLPGCAINRSHHPPIHTSLSLAPSQFFFLSLSLSTDRGSHSSVSPTWISQLLLHKNAYAHMARAYTVHADELPPCFQLQPMGGTLHMAFMTYVTRVGGESFEKFRSVCEEMRLSECFEAILQLCCHHIGVKYSEKKNRNLIYSQIYLVWKEHLRCLFTTLYIAVFDRKLNIRPFKWIISRSALP